MNGFARNAIVIIAVAAVGCGGKPDTVPVRGRVLVRGAPAAFAQVVLHPTEGESGPVYATTDVSGGFQIADAKPGVYAVTVQWWATSNKADPDAGPVTRVDKLAGKYTNPKAPHAPRVTVSSGQPELPPIDL